jgi:regulator of protease activity HflC (stomatin/prohibitin superfamily)
LIVGCLVLFVGLFLALHECHVPEGSSGIYYRFGALSETVSKPGLCFKLPDPITRLSLVDVRPQVDEIVNIQCVSYDKLSIVFPMIKVFNQLKLEDVYQMVSNFGEQYDNYLITEQVRVKVVEMCTTYTAEELYTKEFSKLNDIIFSYLISMQELHRSNLTITHVLVEKLLLPTEVMKRYEQVGTQKAALEAEIQSQLRQMKEQETVSKLAQIKAENEAQLSTINTQTNASRRQIEADTEASILSTRTKAEVQSIRDLAEANALKYTEQYIQLQAIQAWANISKVYYGNAVPEIMIYPGHFTDWS